MFDSPLVVATWVTMILGAWSMQQVGSALHSTEVLRRESNRELARLAADAAVLQVPLDEPGDQLWRRTIGQVSVTVELRDNEIFATSELPSGELYRYAARVVHGAAPEVFGLALSHVVPKLDPRVTAAAASADDLPGFRRDGGVALLHFDGGTDMDDFVFDVERSALDDLSASIITVPGHLWVEPGCRPLELRRERDLTIVVLGNLYVGRSIEIVGPGRVVFVTLGSESARPFVDRDGNGRRSANEPAATSGERVGAIEGGGSVYLGLADSAPGIVVAGGIVVGGYLHLWRDARVDGPVVVAGMPIVVEPGARLVASRQGMFRPERETVPGFVVEGPPRAGLLSAFAVP